MNKFPSYIQINFDGYAEQYLPNVYLSELDSGISKRRLRNSTVQKIISFNGYICNKSDYVDFIHWYKNEINQGSDWFLFIDPIDNIEKRSRIFNTSLQTRPVQSVQNTNLQKWDVTFEIEVWE